MKSGEQAEAVIDDIEILDVDISDRNASLDLMMQKHAEAPLMAQQSTLDQMDQSDSDFRQEFFAPKMTQIS